MTRIVKEASKVVSTTVEWTSSYTKAQMFLIIITTPLELLHVDFTCIETMMKFDQPQNMVNILVFCGHFMKHVTSHVPPIKLPKLLLSFCGKDMSQSLKHEPSSRVTEGPILKATSSESLVSF